MISLIVELLALPVAGAVIVFGDLKAQSQRGRQTRSTTLIPGDAGIRLHEARTRLAVAHAKAQMRATSARLYLELAREIRAAELRGNADDWR